MRAVLAGALLLVLCAGCAQRENAVVDSPSPFVSSSPASQTLSGDWRVENASEALWIGFEEDGMLVVRHDESYPPNAYSHWRALGHDEVLLTQASKGVATAGVYRFEVSDDTLSLVWTNERRDDLVGDGYAWTPWLAAGEEELSLRQ